MCTGAVYVNFINVNLVFICCLYYFFVNLQSSYISTIIVLRFNLSCTTCILTLYVCVYLCVCTVYTHFSYIFLIFIIFCCCRNIQRLSRLICLPNCVHFLFLISFYSSSSSSSLSPTSVVTLILSNYILVFFPVLLILVFFLGNGNGKNCCLFCLFFCIFLSIF